MPIITLTTDFGTTDSYVGQMKGVILGIAPDVRIVDVTHDIPPQDIMRGALVLASAVDAFPDGTIHVAVVDPDVGGIRCPIAVRTRRHILIGPDNGLFSAVLAGQPHLQVVKLSDERFHRHPISQTFHGRDIFAPAAAHLANGTSLDDLGPFTTELVTLDLGEPCMRGDALRAHIIHVDRFGNLVTDLTADQFKRWLTGHRQSDSTTAIRIGDHQIDGVSATFSDAPVGQLVAYFGSGDRLEIAVRNGNAAEVLRATISDVIDLI